MTAEVDRHHPGTCQTGGGREGGWKMKGSKEGMQRKGKGDGSEKDTECGKRETERIR